MLEFAPATTTSLNKAHLLTCGVPSPQFFEHILAKPLVTLIHPLLHHHGWRRLHHAVVLPLGPPVPPADVEHRIPVPILFGLI